MTTKLDPTQNRLKTSQKGKYCGEIGFIFCVGDAEEITDAMRQRAEKHLRHDPQHQINIHYFLSLVTPQGRELDFEMHIL